jgi:hypothetical protein
MREIAVSDGMTSYRGNRGRRHTAPTPSELGKGQKEKVTITSHLISLDIENYTRAHTNYNLSQKG